MIRKSDSVRSAECARAVRASFIIYCVLEKNTGIMPRIPSLVSCFHVHKEHKEVQKNRFLFILNLSACDTTQQPSVNKNIFKLKHFCAFRLFFFLHFIQIEQPPLVPTTFRIKTLLACSEGFILCILNCTPCFPTLHPSCFKA